MTLSDILAVYNGSSGDATKALYAKLQQSGSAGWVVMNLFRACKASERAKVYRGGGYRGLAYEKKAWSMDNLCKILVTDAPALGIAWGWAEDPAQAVHKWVLYIETPHGQVSFHTEYRGEGPGYEKPWDGVRGVGPQRICTWAADLLAVKETVA